MLTMPVSVDIAIFRIFQKQLQVMLVKRPADTKAYPGQWGLPGGIIDESDVDLQQAVHRTLQRRLGTDLGYVEQVLSDGSATRDPRGWSMTTLYVALVAPIETIVSNETAQWFDLTHPQLRALAFDHSKLVQEALARLRNKSAYSLLPAYLLPEEFTYAELQEVYEILLNMSINKSKFRGKLKDHPDLELGKKRTGVAFKPPVLIKVSKQPTQLLFPEPLV